MYCAVAPVPKVLADEFVFDSPRMGAAVRATRLHLDISQKMLAMEMEISQAYMSELERGTRAWDMKLFNRAKEALGRLAK